MGKNKKMTKIEGIDGGGRECTLVLYNGYLIRRIIGGTVPPWEVIVIKGWLRNLKSGRSPSYYDIANFRTKEEAIAHANSLKPGGST